jgi:hypothetical protein
MADKFTYSGNKVKLDIQLYVQEIQMEINALLDRLSLEVNKMVAGGMTQAEANAVVVGWVVNEEEFYGAWANKQKKLISELQKQLVAKPVALYAAINKTQKLKWELGSVKTEHCPDCLYLSQQSERTLKEWRDFGFGLPREGGTECNVGCHCMLSPV